MLMALESVLLGIVKDMGSPKGLSGNSRVFSGIILISSRCFPQDRTRCLQCSTFVLEGPAAQFDCEKREAGHSPSAIFGAFMNTYMDLGSQVIGALDLADRIEDWDPEHQAKLRQAGLRSSFELDDDEGSVFIALTADRYPHGVLGRRNTDGDLFVSRLVNCPQADFATAVEEIKEMGMGLILDPTRKSCSVKWSR